MYFLTFTQTLVCIVKSVYSVYSDVLIIYVHCVYMYILYTNHYISIYTFDYTGNICTVYSAYTVFISVYVLFDIHSNTYCIHYPASKVLSIHNISYISIVYTYT